jgi:DDE superfamily endonuclease
VAALNGWTAQVTYLQRSRIGLHALRDFCAHLRAAYPNAQRVYVVLDNWPLHHSATVVAAMQAHALTPLFLPTYASWLNPIEKLWRWLRQDVLHLHRHAHQLEHLRQLVTQFLDQFASGSHALLRYVGLSVD